MRVQGLGARGGETAGFRVEEGTAGRVKAGDSRVAANCINVTPGEAAGLGV